MLFTTVVVVIHKLCPIFSTVFVPGGHQLQPAEKEELRASAQ